MFSGRDCSNRGRAGGIVRIEGGQEGSFESREGGRDRSNRGRAGGIVRIGLRNEGVADGLAKLAAAAGLGLGCSSSSSSPSSIEGRPGGGARDEGRPDGGGGV